MPKNLTLDNLEQFSVPLENHLLKWKFEAKKNQPISAEFEDQIIALDEEASYFLWKFEQQIKGLHPTNHHFQTVEALSYPQDAALKKWLYQREIPFSQKVFFSCDSRFGFILTWKMVIKHIDSLFFGSHVYIWDKTFNWTLYFDPNDFFLFGKNRIYHASDESDKIIATEQMKQELLAKTANQPPQEIYLPNPFLK